MDFTPRATPLPATSSRGGAPTPVPDHQADSKPTPAADHHAADDKPTPVLITKEEEIEVESSAAAKVTTTYAASNAGGASAENPTTTTAEVGTEVVASSTPGTLAGTVRGSSSQLLRRTRLRMGKAGLWRVGRSVGEVSRRDVGVEGRRRRGEDVREGWDEIGAYVRRGKKVWRLRWGMGTARKLGNGAASQAFGWSAADTHCTRLYRV